MAFGISVTFPLGVYTGHTNDGSAEPLPSVSRLHAALLNSAGQGSTAVLADDRLTPSESSLEALRWLESNPPTAMSVPPHTPVTSRHVIAFRDEGVLEKAVPGGAHRSKKGQRRLSDGHAVGGRLAWLWDTPPPPEIIKSLDEISADVGCLGEAISPAIVRIEYGTSATDLPRTGRLARGVSPFTPGGAIVKAPAPGRTDALVGAHIQAYPRRYPSTTQDRAAWSQLPKGSPTTRSFTEELRYLPDGSKASETDTAPWNTILTLPTDVVVSPHTALPRSLALHRALIARIGDGAPAMITGTYLPGVARPANHLAIHHVPAELLPFPISEPSAYLLLLPSGARPEELADLHRALTGLRHVRRQGETITVSPALPPHNATNFWPAPAGSRYWWTYPAAVPDTGALRGGHGWGFREAALLSIGFTWRDFLGLRRDGSEPSTAWYRRLAGHVASRGVDVLNARRLVTSTPSIFSHRIPTGAVVAPYQAVLDLADLASPRTLTAIGQSRHMGGGLLIPTDLRRA